MGVAAQVHQEIPQQPVHQPGLRHFAGRHLLEGDFQFVQAVVARFIHPRRLAGRADEQPGEQIGQTGVMLPVGEQAAQQIGPAQERAIARRGAAQGDMVATAGTGVPPIQHEFLGTEPRLARILVQTFDVALQFVPVAGGMDIDFDHAGIGRDGEFAQPPVGRRRVTLDQHRHCQLGGGLLDASQQIQIILQLPQRRHEDVEVTFTRLHAQGGVDHGLGIRRRGWLFLEIAARGLRASSQKLAIAAHYLAMDIAQRGAELEQRLRMRYFAVGFPDPGQGRQRQPITHRRVTGNQIQMLATQRPRSAHPSPTIRRFVPANRQRIPGDGV